MYIHKYFPYDRFARFRPTEKSERSDQKSAKETETEGYRFGPFLFRMSEPKPEATGV
jgi:hypothetical protein